MTKKLSFIMLIDDNPDDNFYHERVIKKSGMAEKVLAMTDAADALQYLQSRTATEPGPELIFLDINMPGMNGIEFLQEYRKFPERAVVVMLTTSENPDDKARASATNVIADFRTKPLSKEILNEVISKCL
jgi:CheY-like chemotaxis protein